MLPGQPLSVDVADEIDRVISRYDWSPSSLLNILHEVQEYVGYLPEPVIVRVAERLGVPVADVHGVVSFYALFSMKPKGRYRIAACKGTACYVRGAPRVLERLEAELGIAPGDTTSDGLFSLDVVRCLGACGLGPVVMINDDVHARLKPDRIPGVLKRYRDNS
ncbi:MAG: NADH-quinone oxidoreductase subunit NuoE [Bacillota bacterium]|jgi:NADH-quinone oxidoreductase subunit E/NADP-reducing hydrogenase subunit HndA|nr:MAG: NADH-quinone oxidoreductase subunit NuoE [Bacillota bacterium]